MYKKYIAISYSTASIVLKCTLAMNEVKVLCELEVPLSHFPNNYPKSGSYKSIVSWFRYWAKLFAYQIFLEVN